MDASRHHCLAFWSSAQGGLLDGILYLFGDGSHADKRGSKNPVAPKGRKSQHHPGFLGIRFVLLMAAWDG
jgi:hypothetical protein